MNCSIPDIPALHYLLEFVQNHVSWISDAIQPSHLDITLSHMHTSRLLSTFISYHQVLFVCVLVAQSCLTLCDPMDHCPWGSSVHGIFQARILDWVAFSFSRVSPQPRDWTQVSRIADRLFSLLATRENSRFYLFLTKYLWWSTEMPVMLQSMGSQSGTLLSHWKTAEISLKHVLLSLSPLSWS